MECNGMEWDGIEWIAMGRIAMKWKDENRIGQWRQEIVRCAQDRNGAEHVLISTSDSLVAMRDKVMQREVE